MSRGGGSPFANTPVRKDPMTFKEVLSGAEERFERRRRLVGLFFGPAVFVALYFLPVPGITDKAHALLSVFGFVLVFWLSEAVPLAVTALLGAFFNVLLGVASPEEAFSPFAHPIVFLFIGSFIIAEAISHHGLDKRFALAVFSVKAVQKSPLRALFAVGLVSAVISMWMSNTAAAAMMLPVSLGVLDGIREMRSGKGGGGGEGGGEAGGGGFDMKRYSAMMMLMVAYGASVGGIATPIGTPPNLIGIGMIHEFTGVRISFFEWMAFALPLTVIMFIYLFFILGRLDSFGKAGLPGISEYITGARENLGSWKRGEVNTAVAFGTAVLLWLTPSAFMLLFGKDSGVSRLLSSRLDEGVVALFAAFLLFVLPISLKKMTFTMSWERAARIDWGTIILFGGGLSLGKLMFSTGLAKAFGEGVSAGLGLDSLWTLTAAGTVVSIIVSETTSNTTSANMVIPVVVAMAEGMGVSPIPPALGACLGASFGFMMPVSTPPNAIVYGSGLVPILTMVRKGILFDIGGFFLIMGGLMVFCPLLGWS